MAQANATGIPTIGEVVRAWRALRGLRSIDLAEKAGVRSQYLSEIEHDRTANPQPEYLKRLATALKIPLQVIYGRRMPPDNSVVGTTRSSQPAVGRVAEKASSPSTVYHTPLSISHQEILMHRLAVLQKRLETAEKNLQDANEELHELHVLASEMFGKD